MAATSNAQEAVQLPTMETVPESPLERSVGALELQWHGAKHSQNSVHNRLSHLEQQASVRPSRHVSLEYRLNQLRDIQQHQVTLYQKQQATTFYNQAVDAANARKFQAAVDLYQKALEAYPGMVLAANNLGVLYEQQGRFAEAGKLYEQTIQAAPMEAILHRNIGVVQERQGDIQSALLSFKVYLTLSDKPDPPIESIIENYETNRTMANASDDYMRVVTEASQGRRLLWPVYLTPIRVYVDMEHFDQIPLVPLVKDSYQKWKEATGGRLTFKSVDHPAKADITIYLVPGPLQASFQDVGHADYDVKWDKQDRLKRMKTYIRINTGYLDDPLPLEQRQLLVGRHVLHELGHAIGIWGHSTNPDDVMYTHPIVSDLSIRDVRTIKKLYKLL